MLPAALLAVLSTALTSPSHAATPVLTATTTITARRTAGVVLTVPKDVPLNGTLDQLIPSAVSIARRGGTYAFVGLSQPDLCRAMAEPMLKVCMVVHAYDFGALHDHPQWGDGFAYDAFAFDPPVLKKGRLDVYVVSDGDVTLTLNVKDLRGTTRVRATRPINAWMARLPRNCPRGPCDTAGYGGITHDVGAAGFVASYATAVRQVSVGPSRPSGHAPDPGTQFATSCIYPRSGSAAVSPDPDDHPTGCDLHPLGGDGNWPDHFASLTGSLSPLQTGGGRAHFDYAAKGRVYVGYIAGAVSTLAPVHDYYAYGVWVRAGIR